MVSWAAGEYPDAALNYDLKSPTIIAGQDSVPPNHLRTFEDRTGIAGKFRRSRTRTQPCGFAPSERANKPPSVLRSRHDEGSKALSKVEKFTLSNGVRVLTERVDSVRSASIGLWCQTGSADERDDEAGITHLIEHMLFKGTARRTAKQIAESIEGRGGILNAFTDKQATCYYCRVLADDVENGIDVLSDMMTASLIDPAELEREKGVVLEEIKQGEDEPSDHVHQLHLAGRWGPHPLGKPVIGTRESVSGFAREHLTEYMRTHYRGSRVVLSVAGLVEPDHVRDLAERYLGAIEAGGEAASYERPIGVAAVQEISKPVEMVHFCVGGDGVSLHDPNLHAMAVLDGCLGGGMSSRLFQEIREKRGLAYTIGSYTLSYSTGGAFTVYGGTGLATWPQVLELIRDEFTRFAQHGAEPDELARVKRNIAGNVVLALEGMSARMMRMTRNELYYGREVPLEETMAKIEAVTNDDLVRLASETLSDARVSVTAIGPFGG
jgi:predicted Zn-dependent peptidase